MGEVTMKNGQSVPTNRKKKHTGLKVFLFILLFIFVILPLATVGAVYACFYDSTHKNIPVRADYETTQVLKDVAYSSFDYAKDDQELRIRLTEAALNQVLSNTVKDLGSANGVISNLYVDVYDGGYSFVMEVNGANIFKTRAILTTKLTIDDENIRFKITDVTIGRIHSFQNMVGVIRRFITIPDLSNALAGSGLHIKIDIDNLQLVYRLEDFYNDVSNFIGTGFPYASLITEMIKNEHYRTLYPNKEKALELSINLSGMKADNDSGLYQIENYHVPAGYTVALAEGASTRTCDYLEDNLIDLEDATTVTKYYIVGYDHLTSEEKNKIDTYTLDAPGTTHDYTIAEADKLDNIAKDQIQAQIAAAAPLAPETVNVDISTAQLDKIFKSSEIIGTTIGFARAVGDGTYKAPYIVISRLTSVIKDNHMFLTISADINGCEIHITLKTSLYTGGTPEFGKVQFTIDNMYLGEDIIGEDAKNEFMQLIQQSVGTAAFDNKIQFETVGGTTYLSISIKDLFTETGVIEAAYDTSFSLVSGTASESGHLVFTATKK